MRRCVRSAWLGQESGVATQQYRVKHRNELMRSADALTRFHGASDCDCDRCIECTHARSRRVASRDTRRTGDRLLRGGTG